MLQEGCAAGCQIIPFSGGKIFKLDQVLNLPNVAEELSEMAWLPGLSRCLSSLLFIFFLSLNSFNFFSPHAVRITAAFIPNFLSEQDDLKASHQRLWGRFVTNELIKTSILTSPKRSVSKTNAANTPWYSTFWANPSLLVLKSWGEKNTSL